MLDATIASKVAAGFTAEHSNNSAIAMAYCDANLQLLQPNLAMCILLGVTPEEAVGKNLKDFFRASEAEIEAAFSTGTASSEPIRIVCPNGVKHWGLVCKREIETGLIIQIVEVDDHMRKYIDLTYKESIWRNAIVAADHGVWDFNAVTNERFFSRAWKRMRGLPEDELFDDNHDDWQSRIHPDDLDFVNEQNQIRMGTNAPNYSYEYRERRRDGKWVWILSRGRVVEWDENGLPARMTGTDIDITAMKEAMDVDLRKKSESERAIAQQNEQFDLAISNISQGLCLFDADERLIISNDHYASIYKLEPDMIIPGMHISEIVRLRIEQGIFVSEDFGEDEDIGKRTDKWINCFSDDTQIFHLTDGRYVEILLRPMTGGGWLSTQEDVTARIAAKQDIIKQNEHLDAALSTMNHGLAMYDANETVIVCNDQYAEMYGLSPEQTKPGTNLQDVLKSRLEAGIFAGSSPEEYLKERNHSVQRCDGTIKIHHLNDGRFMEVREMGMANGHWMVTHEDVTERHLSEQRIQYLADFDTLTGLPNRSQIKNVLRTSIAAAVEDGSKLSLLYIDLDGFKEINDTLGHPIGDRVLKTVGERISNLLEDNISVGRLSGDEFIMIVKGTDDVDRLKKLGDRICTSLAVPIQVGEDVVDISASIGISFGPPANGDVDTFVQYSDLALYQAKAEGGNSYQFFEEKMYFQAQKRQLMAADLRNAIKNNELRLHYQPQVNLRSGDINGYEALIRWQHPKLGLVSPFHFIGIAEETGQIGEIGEWVLKTACEYALQWPNKEKVSVNLSPVQFKRQDVVAMVKTALKETGLAPERLELEITESVLIQNTDSVLVILQELSEMGVSIALDDFGTGFSSLSYLTKFPFSKIKIDKSFVDELGVNSEVTAIISMIIGLGRSLKAVITAEGIEGFKQHELLRAAGCDQGQGYMYGKPLPEILEDDTAASRRWA